MRWLERYVSEGSPTLAQYASVVRELAARAE